MTYRQWLAGLAMQGICASSDANVKSENIASWAVDQADAIISELNKKPKE